MRAVRTASAIDVALRKSGMTAERWHERLALVVGTLSPSSVPGHGGEPALRAATLRVLADVDSESVWFTIAVLSGRLPTADCVVQARRASQLDGPTRVLVAALRTVTPASSTRTVHITSDATVVDLGDLVTSPLGTGIQRVARNVTQEWDSTREFEVVGWTDEMDAMTPVACAERERVLAGLAPADSPEPPVTGSVDVVVPWHCTYVLPELAIQPRRCAALQAMATFTATRCGVIGFDCVPLTSSETTAAGFAAVFALNLAAVAQFDVVAAISQAAAMEYRGWRRMLEGAGLDGPHVTAIDLPAHAPAPTDDDLAEARSRLLVADLPMIVCVGSHEPRKNHLAVLHAAEILWRRGRRFSLTFIGGASWGSDQFLRRLGELQGAGRPVESISKLPDRLLWAAYRLARCTVFPSLNEGFGLPVAESLAAGTPVITSSAGSMLDIAAGGGAITVDPRDDAALTRALDMLVTDDTRLAGLRAESRLRSPTSWSTYADELWATFHADGATVVAGDPTIPTGGR